MKSLAAVLLCLVAVAQADQKTPAIRYSSFKRGKVYYHAVTCDMASGAVSMKTMFSPRLVSVWDFIGKEQPVVALTGTFFNPQNHKPVADVLVDGNLRAKGSRGSGVGVDWLGTVSIFDKPFRKNVDWSKYQFGLRGAIRVVNNGVVQPNPKAQKFKDPRLWSSAARTGLGLTKSGKLIILATAGNVTLSEFGKAMVSMGVRSGIALDGGTSACLYYNGALVIPPGRKLSNMVVITRRSPIAMR